MTCFKKVVLLLYISFGYLVIFNNALPAGMINETTSTRSDNEFQSNSTTPTLTNSENSKERVDIIYDLKEYKEIDQDILQVSGNLQQVSLFCFHTISNKSRVRWVYHGLGEKRNRIEDGEENDVYINLPTDDTPVSRLECLLADNEAITNNTFIYTGEDKPPYLYNNGKSIKPIVFNETTVLFPCVLNYPLENSNSNKELQLYKGGELVENKNNCLSYSPEFGYFLNLTKLDIDPLGEYKCQVVNSTDDDYVLISLKKGDFLAIKYNGNREIYYEKTYSEQFQCSAPESMFEDDFKWYYLWRNGTAELIPAQNKFHPDWLNKNGVYSLVNLTFSSVNITHVVCEGVLKDSLKPSNVTFPVKIVESHGPNILNGPIDGPLIYTSGKNLTCASTGEPPVEWIWLKDGKKIESMGNITHTYPSGTSPVARSTLDLNPSADEKEVNYTCVAKNLLGSANYSFRVQLPATKENYKTLLVLVLTALAFIAIFFAVFLLFFKIGVKRRQLGSEHIRNFFEGLGNKKPKYNELEPYASVSYYDAYDQKKEIKYNSLIFERELKGGQFGRVMFGRKVDLNNGSSIPVAIKTIKDNQKKSKEEVEEAFINFLNEIKWMQGLGYHPNIVGYVGAVTTDIAKYTAYLVVEYCNGGDLKSYLKKNRSLFHDDVLGSHVKSNCIDSFDKSQPVLKTSQLMKWAEQIATGMEYIASKNLLHLDLAARNVLLGYQGINSEDCSNPDPSLLIAKISDFGLSKNLDETNSDYYEVTFQQNSRPRMFPLRWFSIEALTKLRFSTESDIWALAVTFWEIFTLAEKVPYADVIPERHSDLRNELISYLVDGNVLSQPDYAPAEVWDIMVRCWAENPQDRPSLTAIKETLNGINETFRIANAEEPDNKSADGSYGYGQPFIVSSYSTVGILENLTDNPTENLGPSHGYVNESISLQSLDNGNENKESEW